MITFTIPVRTVSESNAREHHHAKARRTSANRGAAFQIGSAYVLGVREALALRDASVVVTVTRIAPSAGLDPHENLPASQKAIVDGLADALGLKNDRDPRVSWRYEQRRGRPREYAVEVRIEAAS